MSTQKHHFKPPEVKRLESKQVGPRAGLPIHWQHDLQLNLPSEGLSFLIYKIRQLDKTSKAPFQLYLSNCMILEAISKLYIVG